MSRRRLHGVGALVRRSASSRTRLKGIEKRLARLQEPIDELRRLARYESAHVRAGRLDYDNAEIWLRLGSFREFQRLRSCGAEPWTVQWIEDRVQAGEVVYDLGANVGAYSLVAALKPGGGASVYAFEPGYSTYAALVDNIALNEADASVIALPIAIGATTGRSTLHLSQLDAGAALHRLGETLDGAALRQPVLVFRLDDAVERLELPRPAHLKLDVDGAELEVLEGAPRVLDDPGLLTVLCELDHEHADEVVAVLGRHGLRLDERFDRPPKKGQAAAPPAYGIFVRAEPAA